MNRLKKYASLLLALVMALALAVPAMATEASGPAPVTGPFEITITNATTGHTYEAYQIFKGDLSATDQTATDLTAPVLSNIEWGAGVNAELALAAAQKVLEDTTLATAAQVAEKLTESNAAAFAQAMKDALTTVNGTATAESDTVKITATAGAGYYLIKDSKDSVTGDDSVTLFMLQVVGPTEVKAKAGTPTPDKKIVEGENKVNTGDYDIGETITFELKATLPVNYKNYKEYTLVFHDTMSDGLDYIGISSVTVDGKVATEGSYVVTPPTKTADGKNTELTIRFDNLVASYENLDAGDEIVIIYTAKLNASAEIGNPGNPNTMHLEFSNNPNDNQDGTGETPKKEVVVFTYELDGTKVDGQDKNEADGSYNTMLKDAEFHLARKNAEGNYEWYQINEETKEITWVPAGESAPTVKDENEEVPYGGSVIKSGEDGKFAIKGLDQDTYYLFETKAPVGYNLPNKHVTLVIEATYEKDPTADKDVVKDLTLTVDTAPSNGDTETGIVNTTIENNKGATLPETGGIGTTIFYALGGLLTVGAVVLLVTKKRMSADEK